MEKFHEMSVGGGVLLPDGDQSNESQSNYKYNNLSPENLLTQNKSITVLEKNDHSSALQLPLAADARSNVGGSKLDCWQVPVEKHDNLIVKPIMKKRKIKLKNQSK